MPTVGVAIEGVVVPGMGSGAVVVPRPLERAVDVAFDVVRRQEVTVIDTVGAGAPRPVLRQLVPVDLVAGDVVRVLGGRARRRTGRARCHEGHRGAGDRRRDDGLLLDGQSLDRLGLESDDGLDESRIFTHQLGGGGCQQLTLWCGQGPTSNDACLDVTESGGDCHSTDGTGVEQTAHTHTENADDGEPTQLFDGIHTILPFFLGVLPCLGGRNLRFLHA